MHRPVPCPNTNQPALAPPTLCVHGQVDAEEGKPVEAAALGEQLKRVRAATDRAMKGRVRERGEGVHQNRIESIGRSTTDT